MRWSSCPADGRDNGFSGPSSAKMVGALPYAETRVGWTAGAGFEWMFARRWSAKAEYFYYDLGKANSTASALVNLGGPTSAVPGGIYSSATPVVSAHFNGSIVRAGRELSLLETPAGSRRLPSVPRKPGPRRSGFFRSPRSAGAADVAPAMRDWEARTGLEVSEAASAFAQGPAHRRRRSL